MKSSGYIVITHRFYQEGNKWVAICMELGTTTFGRTLKQAKERLFEAILCHLNTLEKVGECERFFKENNIKFYRHKPVKKNITLDVPVQLLKDKESVIQHRLTRVHV